MDRTTTFGDIQPRNAAHAAKRMLKTARFFNVTARYSEVDPLPRNAGDTLKFRRYNDLPIPDAPLSEVINPEASIPTFEDVEVTVEEYGQIVRLTQKIKDMHEDPVFQEMFDKAGKAMGECSQLVDFNSLKAGTNAYYSGGTTRATVNASITNNLCKKVIRQLSNDGGSPITRRIKAGVKIATEPVPEAYIGIVHTDLRADLENLDGWQPVAFYSDSDKADPGEIGQCEGIRFIVHRKAPKWLAAGVSGSTYLTNGASGTGECDVYPLIVVSEDSYSRVPLSGKEAVKPMVVNPGKPSPGDPTGRFGSIAWVAYFACVITNQAWVARVEVGATAL